MNYEITYKRNGDKDYATLFNHQTKHEIQTDYLYIKDIGNHQDLSMRNKNQLFLLFKNEHFEEIEKNLFDIENLDDQILAKFAFIENNELIISSNEYPTKIYFFRDLAWYHELNNTYILIDKSENIISNEFEEVSWFDDFLKTNYNDFNKFFIQTEGYIGGGWHSNYQTFNYGIGISQCAYENGISELLGEYTYVKEDSTSIEKKLGVNHDFSLNSVEHFHVSPLIDFNPQNDNTEIYKFNLEANGLAVVTFNNRKYFMNRYFSFIGPKEGFSEVLILNPRKNVVWLKDFSFVSEYDFGEIEISNEEGESGPISFQGNFIEEFLLFPQLFFKHEHIKEYMIELFNSHENNFDKEIYQNREYIAWDEIILQNLIEKHRIFDPNFILSEDWKQEYISSEEFISEILSMCPFILPENLRTDKIELRRLINQHNELFGVIHSSIKFEDYDQIKSLLR